jgi:hypothetical protein
MSNPEAPFPRWIASRCRTAIHRMINLPHGNLPHGNLPHAHNDRFEIGLAA